MKKKIKNIVLRLVLLLLVSYSLNSHAQVTIGTGSTPVSGSLLQLKQDDNANANSKKGLGMPRVRLTNLTPTTPAALAASIGGSASDIYDLNQHIGLVVYNVQDNLCIADPIAKGIYVWDGTRWQSILPVTLSPVLQSATATPTSVCSGVATILSGVVDEGSTIRWHTALSGGTAIGTGTSFSVSPTTTTTYYAEAYNTTTNCASSLPRKALTVTVAAAPTPTITGANSGTANSTGNVYSTQAGMNSYVWTVTGGTIVSGLTTNSITIAWGAAGSGSVKVDYANAGGCVGTTMMPVTIKTLPVAVGTGVLAGKVCFDIAVSNDNTNACGTLVSRQTIKSNFAQTATNTQTYTFTPSGATSNVRFVSVNVNGTVVQSITPNGNYAGNNIYSACTATVVYSSTLNNDAKGTYTDGTGAFAPYTADIYAIYNNNSAGTGTDVMIKLSVTIKDCSCCGAFVAPGKWKNFMCHNLGADVTKDPLLPTQAIAGNYYQWGRPTVVATASTGSGAIAGWNTTNAADKAWNSGTEATPVKTGNDPCPTGYRMPTNTEWEGVIANNPTTSVGTWSTIATDHTKFDVGRKFGDYLFLPAAGYRHFNDGTLTNRGRYGYYRSSTETSTSAWSMYIASGSGGAYPSNINRTYGLSVRCVSEK